MDVGDGEGASGGAEGKKEADAPRRPVWGARSTTRWICARCETTYKTRGPNAEQDPHARERVGCCPICRALLKAKRRSAPGALPPDLLAAMERLGRRVVPMKRRDARPGMD